jgi:coenzyme F420-reducing hydrogenase gamma subunit
MQEFLAFTSLMLPVLHKHCFTPLPRITFARHSCETRLARSATVQRHPGRGALTCRAGSSSVQVTLQTPSGQQKTIKKVFVDVHAAIRSVQKQWREELVCACLMVEQAYIKVSVFSQRGTFSFLYAGFL